MPERKIHKGRKYCPKKRIVPHTLPSAAEEVNHGLPRLSALKVADEENWMYDAILAGHSVRVVIDSFASHNFLWHMRKHKN